MGFVTLKTMYFYKTYKMQPQNMQQLFFSMEQKFTQSKFCYLVLKYYV